MSRFLLKVSQSFALLAALACLNARLCLPAQAQSIALLKGYNFQTLHSFAKGADGAGPIGGLVVDKNGNVYGTTIEGGANDRGTIFEYAPEMGTFSTLYSFTGGADGGNPWGKLIMDSSGALYGSAYDGGAGGSGTLFKYTPGAHSFTTLYAFSATVSFDGSYANNDGAYPQGGQMMDGSGNLYGTTTYGGPYGSGTIFEYLPASQTLLSLYAFSELSFTGSQYVNSDGALPQSALVMDSSGNLYGTAPSGGVTGLGVLFQFALDTGTYTALYTFHGGNDGDIPFTGLMMDSSGNLYGSAAGGATDNGSLFKYAPSEGAYNVFYSFTGGSGGSSEISGLLMDPNGALYGVTVNGGTHGEGIVFKYAPETNTFDTLHNFSAYTDYSSVKNGENSDGANPEGGLVMDNEGALYGIAPSGGAYGWGTFFVLRPQRPREGDGVIFGLPGVGTTGVLP